MSDPRPTSFTYRPLSHSSKEFRLLHLLPSPNPSSAIECRIQHSSLSSSPQYEALSYVWGKDTAAESILLQGQSITIRQNLLGALRHLRYYDQERTLWIDAICIDQENIVERNHQVRQMGAIYSTASLVISWLGYASSDSQFAIEFLRDRSSTQDGTVTNFVRPMPTRKRRKAVRHLLEREYWRRVWIVQEVVLARDIYLQCGDSGICWEGFVRGVNSSIGESVAAHLDNQRKKRGKGDDVKLFEIMFACMGSLCSDPRDKVFAFLGIAGDCHGKLEADYSLSTWDLYEWLVEFLSCGGTGTANSRPGFVADVKRFAHTILGAPMPPVGRILPLLRGPEGVAGISSLVRNVCTGHFVRSKPSMFLIDGRKYDLEGRGTPLP